MAEGRATGRYAPYPLCAVGYVPSFGMTAHGCPREIVKTSAVLVSRLLRSC